MKNNVVVERRVRSLLHLGRSVSEVAEIMSLPESIVLELSDTSNLPQAKIMPAELERLPENDPVRCPICKGRVTSWPCLICNPEAGRGSSRPVLEPQAIGEVTRIESLALLHIVEDIREINRRELIRHPLFISLAKRAENVLARIA